MIRYNPKPRKRDPSIALINIVFLMLIFFLLTGTIAPPLDSKLNLVETSGLEGREPPDALVLRADGTLHFRGSPVEPDAYMTRHASGPVRIVPDRMSPAPRLVEITTALRRAGAVSVVLVTERALE